MNNGTDFFQVEGPNSVMPTNSNEPPAPELLLGLPPKVVTTKHGYTRTLHARLVLFRCEWCSQERQVWQYPGAAPRYCKECREEAQQSMNSARQREKRERERNANPYARRRPVGRPRKDR